MVGLAARMEGASDTPNGTGVGSMFVGSAAGAKVKKANPQVAEAQGKLNQVINEMGKKLVGRDEKNKLILATILAGGHVLLESAPGMGKTLTAELLAETLNLSDRRIQFTPDTMPSDIRGSEVLNDDPEGPKFIFAKGPIFTQFLLADEINRGNTRSQAAFFEAMAEGKLTLTNGDVLPLPKPFVMIATQNPIEQEGTNPLPEAQLDRFATKIGFDELSEELSFELLRQKAIADGAPSDEKEKAAPILSDDVNGEHELIGIQRLIAREVTLSEDILHYINRVTRGIKPHVEGAPQFIKDTFQDYSASGARPADIMMKLSRAVAFLDGRTVVEIPDVQAVADLVLIHRVRKKRGIDAMEDPRAAIKQLAQEMTPGR